MNYSIENLDVYRKSIVTGAAICRAAAEAEKGGGVLLARQLQRSGLAAVTNLAVGLGFWEREKKVEHFTASKSAVLEALPLLEVMSGLGLLGTDARAGLAEELRDLAKMISGLLRGALRREHSRETASRQEAEVREPGNTYH